MGHNVAFATGGGWLLRSTRGVAGTAAGTNTRCCTALPRLAVSAACGVCWLWCRTRRPAPLGACGNSVETVRAVVHARGNPLVSHERGEQVRPREHLLSKVARGLLCRAFIRPRAGRVSRPGHASRVQRSIESPSVGEAFPGRSALLPSAIAMTECGNSCARRGMGVQRRFAKARGRNIAQH